MTAGEEEFEESTAAAAVTLDEEMSRSRMDLGGKKHKGMSFRSIWTCARSLVRDGGAERSDLAIKEWLCKPFFATKTWILGGRKAKGVFGSRKLNSSR